jgi:hypothetical protein
VSKGVKSSPFHGGGENKSPRKCLFVYLVHATDTTFETHDTIMISQLCRGRTARASWTKVNVIEASLPSGGNSDISARLEAAADEIRWNRPFDALFHFRAISELWGTNSLNFIFTHSSLPILLRDCVVSAPLFVRELVFFIDRLCHSPPIIASDCVIGFLLAVVDKFAGETSVMSVVCSSLLALGEANGCVTSEVILAVLRIASVHWNFELELMFSMSEEENLAMTVVGIFELYLDSGRGRGQVNIVFDHLLRLSTSGSHDLSLACISVLIRASRLPEFMARLRALKAVIALAFQLNAFREQESQKGCHRLFLLFAEITRLGTESDNLWLLVRAPVLVQSLLAFVDWNMDLFYEPACRITAHLVCMVRGFVKMEMIPRLIDRLLRQCCDSMNILAKIAAGILFAHSVLRVRQRYMSGFLEYGFVLDCFPDFFELASDEELAVLLKCVLRLLSTHEMRRQLAQHDDLAKGLAHLYGRADHIASQILDLMQCDDIRRDSM